MFISFIKIAKDYKKRLHQGISSAGVKNNN